MLRVAAARLARQAQNLPSGQSVRCISYTRNLMRENSEEARYVGGKHKLVDPVKAIEMIDKVPPIKSHKRIASCDGGGGALGHPKVFINLDSPGPHPCGYCGLRFEYDHHHH